MEFTNYNQINDFRLQGIALASRSNQHLNDFHDLIYENVITFALKQIRKTYGDPPCSYTFFALGSAGRLEQSIWSDQDHGIVFEEDNDVSKKYFLELGQEISSGLEAAGYPKCSGRVMSSNPLWCRPLSQWVKQIHNWKALSSWESIRNLLILADARSLYGESHLLENIQSAYISVVDKSLLIRMLQNNLHFKKGVGVLGQLLLETHGTFSGTINLKETALLPFVNSARLMAVYERITATSTHSRINLVSSDWLSNGDCHFFANNFSRLLDFRLKHGNHSNYESGHYVTAGNLTKSERKELKDLLRAGEQLFLKVNARIEKGNKDENE